MSRNLVKGVVSLMCVTLALVVTAPSMRSQAQDTPQKLRVGVYDNRAIAMAYFHSAHNAFIAKRDEFQSAQKAGDSTRIVELNDWVKRFQRQIHFQGFCRAPVDDLLAEVRDGVAEVAKSHQLDLIGWYPDYASDNIEIVDITGELVALFEPNPEKLNEIANIKNIEPVALCDISDNE